LSYHYAEHSKFKRIWDNSNIIERKKYIKKARLEHIIINKNLHWNEIESNFQAKLRDAIRKGDRFKK